MEIIVTSEERIRQIFTECLSNYNPSPVPVPQPETRNIYSIKEFAEFLHCSTTTAQKIKNSGKVRFKQFGRKCVFNTAEILEDLANNRSRKTKR